MVLIAVGVLAGVALFFIMKKKGGGADPMPDTGDIETSPPSPKPPET
jgi:hypothetical protein